MPTTITKRPPPTSGIERYRWTRERYERAIAAGVFEEDDRIELVDGEVVTMRPQGSRHNTLMHRLTTLLEPHYEGRFYVRMQGPLALGASSEPEPDIAVVSGRPADHLDAHPTSALLVVEVADTSLDKDRSVKKALYARHGIPEYWILNLNDEALEVYRDPTGDTYATKRTLQRGDAVTLPEGTDALALDDLLP
ncbi:MAG: Uma2 family endonuclease [Bacteroidetes bacterium]|jgi:Uma2 family endonuclease|nr:Uma2 family endonuclease [Bacteroidota bacterium]